jgi:hypothetical protein
MVEIESAVIQNHVEDVWPMGDYVPTNKSLEALVILTLFVYLCVERPKK